jgi:hypothetical protein
VLASCVVSGIVSYCSTQHFLRQTSATLQELQERVNLHSSQLLEKDARLAALHHKLEVQASILEEKDAKVRTLQEQIEQLQHNAVTAHQEQPEEDDDDEDDVCDEDDEEFSDSGLSPWRQGGASHAGKLSSALGVQRWDKVRQSSVS